MSQAQKQEQEQTPEQREQERLDRDERERAERLERVTAEMDREDEARKAAGQPPLTPAERKAREEKANPPAAEGDAVARRRAEQEQERVEAAEKAAKVPRDYALPNQTPADRQTAEERDREAATQAAIEYGKQSQAQHDAHQAALKEAAGREAGAVDPIEALCQAFESLPMSIGPNVRALVNAARAGSTTPISKSGGDETNPDLRGSKTAREDKTQGQAHRSEPDRSGPDQHRGKDT